MRRNYLDHPQIPTEVMKFDDAYKYLEKQDARLLTAFEDNYNTNTKNKSFKNGFSNLMTYKHLLNKPIVVVAASPHLDLNLHHLKEYQDKCLIICADVVLKRLMEEGIKPDFCINLDVSDKASKGWIGLDTKDIALVCPTIVNPITLERWQGKTYFFNAVLDSEIFPKGKLLKELAKKTWSFGNLQSFHFVGFTGIQIAYTLKASVAMLIGYGFSFLDDKPYAGKIAEDVVDEGVKYEEEQTVINGRIEVEGQQTLRNLLLYRECTETLLDEANAKSVINCTEGGLLNWNNSIFKDCLEKYCTDKIRKAIKYKRKRRK